MAASSFYRPQQRRTIRLVVAAFLILLSVIIILADRQQATSLSSGRLNLDDPSAKVLGVIAVPARMVTAMLGEVESRSNIVENNKQLKADLAQLRVENAELVETISRLERFERIVGVEVRTAVPLRRIAARAVDEQNGPFVHSALINVGTKKGVKHGYAVMTSDGYYGHVVRVGSVSARVLLANDLSSRIAVKSTRSGSRAIMVGTNGTKPELRYISEQGDWQDGDMVVSSGDDGILPVGLPIGTSEMREDAVFQAKLFSTRNPVDWVYVTDFIPIEPPRQDLLAQETIAIESPEQEFVDTDNSLEEPQ